MHARFKGIFNCLVRLYNVIDKNLKGAQEAGNISEVRYLQESEWAIKQLYTIQNNSRLLNAIKLYRTLT